MGSKFLKHESWLGSGHSQCQKNDAQAGAPFLSSGTANAKRMMHKQRFYLVQAQPMPKE
jgi:hypothetical protein